MHDRYKYIIHCRANEALADDDDDFLSQEEHVSRDSPFNYNRTGRDSIVISTSRWNTTETFPAPGDAIVLVAPFNVDGIRLTTYLL